MEELDAFRSFIPGSFSNSYHIYIRVFLDIFSPLAIWPFTAFIILQITLLALEFVNSKVYKKVFLFFFCFAE